MLGAIKWIISIFGVLGAISFLPFLIIGIITYGKASDENDLERKKHWKKKGWFLILLPTTLQSARI